MLGRKTNKKQEDGSGKIDEMPDLNLIEPLFRDSELIVGHSEDVGGYDSCDPRPIQNKIF